jgi:hypothetical protein
MTAAAIVSANAVTILASKAARQSSEVATAAINTAKLNRVQTESVKAKIDAQQAAAWAVRIANVAAEEAMRKMQAELKARMNAKKVAHKAAIHAIKVVDVGIAVVAQEAAIYDMRELYSEMEVIEDISAAVMAAVGAAASAAAAVAICSCGIIAHAAAESAALAVIQAEEACIAAVIKKAAIMGFAALEGAIESADFAAIAAADALAARVIEQTIPITIAAAKWAAVQAKFAGEMVPHAANVWGLIAVRTATAATENAVSVLCAKFATEPFNSANPQAHKANMAVIRYFQKKWIAEHSAVPTCSEEVRVSQVLMYGFCLTSKRLIGPAQREGHRVP